ncbi:FitA-like ribbon-helix-helix domain-containing protein [Sphingopyxis macrogoltabida]|uniref:Plasmid stabilization protein n=1 Tax=Sphingopyxis macrogoltabida TaxID=33050 RepID=A0AAC9AZG2_SPHMC|nr:hypothetical protein [Sphingopyxis macrogoltabida]ALJ16573.1 plasmid stabilization protein [Sphingopyxis macrogoltabida]AMU92802.1 plasmid stabilization protein [Sphingopyxis macrogoltabida]
MGVLTIRNLDDPIKMHLCIRAARHGRSVEDEVRDILLRALSAESPAPEDLGKTIHCRFTSLGGIDLVPPPRESIRRLPDFGE